LSNARFLTDEKTKGLKGTDVNVFNIYGGIDYNSDYSESKVSYDKNNIYQTHQSKYLSKKTAGVKTGITCPEPSKKAIK
jgi:hypothetical protein